MKKLSFLVFAILLPFAIPAAGQTAAPGQRAGADLTHTLLPGRGHDIVDHFENRALYACLLRHRRP